MTTIEKIKLALRRSHSKLDEDLQADIDACLADLKRCGISEPDEMDPLIFNCVKLWCKSLDSDDPAKGAEYLERYNAMKGGLMMSTGYGVEDDAEVGGDD